MPRLSIIRGSWFWIVGGPNGSGKSSLIRHGALDHWTGGMGALSPDDIVLQLRSEHPDWSEIDLLRVAQATSDTMVDSAIAGGTGVMVETVLSSDKFKGRVLEAAGAGLSFGFVFVTVAAPSLNEARVLHRVARGGHDVPTDRIRSRRVRAHANAPWFAQRCRIGLVFDNSGAAPTLLAEKHPDEPTWRLYEPERLRQLGLHLDPEAPPSA